jgi:hypothetical protein
MLNEFDVILSYMIEVILILWRKSGYPQKLPDTNETLWIIQGYGYDRFVCMLILFIFSFLFMATQSHFIWCFSCSLPLCIECHFSRV